MNTHGELTSAAPGALAGPQEDSEIRGTILAKNHAAIVH